MRKSADIYRYAVTLWREDGVTPGGHIKVLDKCARDLQDALDELEVIRFWGGDLKAADEEMRKRKFLPKPTEEAERGQT